MSVPIWGRSGWLPEDAVDGDGLLGGTGAEAAGGGFDGGPAEKHWNLCGVAALATGNQPCRMGQPDDRALGGFLLTDGQDDLGDPLRW